jgi:glutathione S-transferase
MEIFGSILSPFVARVVMMARHKGLKHTLAMPKDGLKSPDFLKLSPFGRMPAIRDGKTVLYESGVILDYLDLKYKKKRSVPTAANTAAHARLIAAICSEYLQPACFELFLQVKPATRDQKIVDEEMALLTQTLDTLERTIAGKPYAAGSKVSIADFYLVPALFVLDVVLPQIGAKTPLGSHAKLARYYAKARKDKLLGGVLKDMYAALAERYARGGD